MFSLLFTSFQSVVQTTKQPFVLISNSFICMNCMICCIYGSYIYPNYRLTMGIINTLRYLNSTQVIITRTSGRIGASINHLSAGRSILCTKLTNLTCPALNQFERTLNVTMSAQVNTLHDKKMSCNAVNL